MADERFESGPMSSERPPATQPSPWSRWLAARLRLLVICSVVWKSDPSAALGLVVGWICAQV